MKRLIIGILATFCGNAYAQQNDCDTAYEKNYRYGYISITKVEPIIVPVNTDWNLNLNGKCNPFTLNKALNKGKEDGKLYLIKLKENQIDQPQKKDKTKKE